MVPIVKKYFLHFSIFNGIRFVSNMFVQLINKLYLFINRRLGLGNNFQRPATQKINKMESTQTETSKKFLDHRF